MSRRELFWSPLLCAASLLLPLAVLEVLALAPARQWSWLSVWSTQGAAVALVILATAAAGAAATLAAGTLRKKARGDDAIVLLVLAVVAVAHLRRPLARWLGAGDASALLVLGLLIAAVFAGLKLLAVRRGLTFAEVRPIVVALLALPIGLTAIHRATAVPADAPHPTATVAGAVAYLLLIAAAIAWGGRRRSSLLAATLILALAALRVLVPNAHELRVAPAGRVEPQGLDGAGGPPVLLIVLDTLRADALDLSAPESSHTPNLARFARDADLYTNAIANASWSLPGHASLFTGLNVSQHRTDGTDEPGFGNQLPPSLLTAQELFARHGYRTSCAVANGLISVGTGLARGFHRYVHPGAEWILESFPIKVLQFPVGRWQRWAFKQVIVDLTGLNIHAGAREIVDYALGETADAVYPLYLFLNFMDAHEPYPAAPGEPLGQRAAVLGNWSLYVFGNGEPARANVPGAELFSVARDSIRSRYRASVEQLDRELGRLFDTLRRRGWYERMLIVVTADHGQAMGENPRMTPYWGHHSALEPAVRIPLLIKRPGQDHGSSWRHAVQQTDVLPAILAIAGLPARVGLASRVLAPELDLSVLTEWYPVRGFTKKSYSRLAVYRNGYKFVVEEPGEREFLYDLEQSPYEEVDVLAQEGSLAAELREELNAAIRSSRAQGLERLGISDPAVREQLKALGYVP